MLTNDFAHDSNISNRTEYKDGYLRVDNNILSRATVSPYYAHQVKGAIQNGYKPNQIINLLRTPEELEKAKMTFDGLPLLLEHHNTTSKNINTLPKIGSVSYVDYKNNNLMGTLFIHDSNAIDLIQHSDENNKITGISCSYAYDTVFKKGEYEGKTYDAYMTNIVGNHIALVKKGRVEEAVIADENIKKGSTKMNLKSFFKLIPSSKYANDEEMKFTPMDLRSVMRDIEASDLSEEDKDNRIKDLMERMSQSSIDKVLQGNTTDKISTDKKASDEDDIVEEKIEKIEVIDNEMIKKMIYDAVEDAVSKHLEKIYQSSQKEDIEQEKAMDEALRDYRILHGEPNISAFNNKAENVYKSILKHKGIACDSMDIKELKLCTNVLKQSSNKNSYAFDSKEDSKSPSILDNELVKSRKVK